LSQQQKKKKVCILFEGLPLWVGMDLKWAEVEATGHKSAPKISMASLIINKDHISIYLC